MQCQIQMCIKNNPNFPVGKGFYTGLARFFSPCGVGVAHCMLVDFAPVHLLVCFAKNSFQIKNNILIQIIVDSKKQENVFIIMRNNEHDLAQLNVGTNIRFSKWTFFAEGATNHCEQKLK